MPDPPPPRRSRRIGFAGRPPGLNEPRQHTLAPGGLIDVSDEALLAGLGAGDETAAAVFVRRFQQRVFGLARTIVGDDGRAADVAQEAFMRAWRHAPTYDARRGSVVTWLLSITRNLAIDRLRVEQARPVDDLDRLVSPPASAERQPDEMAVTGDEMRRVRAALEGLPGEQRRALVLAALGGRTAKEVGELEEIPLGTAKTRIRTALIHVRDALEQDRPQ
ncbi:MAG TPA: sigma-70 family RNA polymerase sigma factor [Acidimicrobiales bacterium]